MRKAVLPVCAVLFLVTQALISSQSSVPPRSATDVTNADIRATIKMAPPDGIQDQQIRVVDMGKYNVTVGVLVRVDADHVLPAGYVNPAVANRQ